MSNISIPRVHMFYLKKKNVPLRCAHVFEKKKKKKKAFHMQMPSTKNAMLINTISAMQMQMLMRMLNADADAK